MNTSEREALIAEIRTRLHAQANAERAKKMVTFFPSKPPVLGTPSGFSREVGAEVARKLKVEGDLDDVVAVAEALFGSGVVEEGACADEMLGKFWRRFGPDDWDIFDRWLDSFTSWGTTDSFCIKVLGYLVLRDGPPMDRLRAWARAVDIWHRRASLACFVRAARKARFVEEMCEIADLLLADSEDLIQKVIGWMFKELCQGDAEATIAYLQSRREQMSRLALRYSCEKMTPEQKARALGNRMSGRDASP